MQRKNTKKLAATIALSVTMLTSSFVSLTAFADETTTLTGGKWVELMSEFNSGSMPSSNYSDVPSDHWAKLYVDFMSAEGFMRGYPEGDFRPSNPITRAEVAVVLDNMLEPKAETQEPLSDVSNDAWYASTMKRAVAAGFLKGYDDGTYRPEGQITRQEAAVVIYRAFGFTPEELSTSFDDHDDIASWAVAQVAVLVHKGVISGYDNNTFRPENKVTRAEIAAMVCNAAKAKAAEEQVAPVSSGSPGGPIIIPPTKTDSPSGSNSSNRPDPSPETYTITVQVHGEGKVQWGNTQSIANLGENSADKNANGKVTNIASKSTRYFKFVPTEGYEIDEVKYAGNVISASAYADGFYSITNIRSNGVLTVTFKQTPVVVKQLNVTVGEAGEKTGGTFTYKYDGTTTKGNWDSAASMYVGTVITFTPPVPEVSDLFGNYHVETVTVNGVDVTNKLDGTSLTLEEEFGINDACDIKVTYADDKKIVQDIDNALKDLPAEEKEAVKESIEKTLGNLVDDSIEASQADKDTAANYIIDVFNQESGESLTVAGSQNPEYKEAGIKQNVYQPIYDDIQASAKKDPVISKAVGKNVTKAVKYYGQLVKIVDKTAEEIIKYYKEGKSTEYNDMYAYFSSYYLNTCVPEIKQFVAANEDSEAVKEAFLELSKTYVLTEFGGVFLTDTTNNFIKATTDKVNDATLRLAYLKHKGYTDGQLKADVYWEFYPAK